MRRGWRIGAAALGVAASMASPGAARSYEALRSIDGRVAAVAYRLSTANAALCAARAPATGLVLHAIDQYPSRERAGLRRSFGFDAPVAIEAVVPGSPAARAGAAAGDALLAVDGRGLAGEIGDRPTSATRDAALAAIEAAGAKGPLTLRLARGGAERSVAIVPVAGCAIRVEVAIGRDAAAARAGRAAIRIGAALPLRYDDEALAVIVAHELAHVVLGHAAPPADAGADRRRAAEDEADQLSVVLLAGAGFDPHAAARFWLAHGREVEPGRTRLHRPPRERAALLAAAATRLAPVPGQ